MRFLFINPPRTLSRASIWNVIASSTPPVGIALLAALLEKFGTPTDIIDAQALNLSPEEVVLLAGAKSYDIIGITATTPEISSAIATANLLRRAIPNARILFGGVHPTLFHHELVESGVADFVIRGEAEESIVRLALSTEPALISGLTWKNGDGQVIVNEPAVKTVDIDQLPLPAYHKLPMIHYRSALGAAQKSPSIGIITSRGCPGSCTFCYSGMFGKTIRYVSADNVYEHIVHLQDLYGIREISFYDDTFTSDRNRVISLCNRMINERTKLSWSCFARVDTVDQELLAIMRKAGCHQIMYGFESSDDAVLKTINKCVTTKRYHEVVTMTRSAGINIRGAFMLGNPGETEQSLMNTIRYSTNMDIQFAIFNITTPYPGTALYAWAINNARLIHQNWDEYDLSHPILALPTVSAEVIQQQYQQAYRHFYLRPTYILLQLPNMVTTGLLSTGVKAFWGIIRMVVQRRSGGVNK